MKKEQKQFIYYWYKEFNWKKDPFESRFNYPITKFIVGYEKERRKLNYFVIDRLPLAVITGKDGYGKSTLLLWLKEELSKYKESVIVDYINNDVDFFKFVKALIYPFLGVKEKLVLISSRITSKSLNLIEDKSLVSIAESIYFKKSELDLNKLREFLYTRLKGRLLVLLVDDFDAIDQRFNSLIKFLLESNLQTQIALSSRGNLDKISRKNSVKISLEGLTLPECRDMVSKRILNVGGDGLTPLSGEIFGAIHKKSNGSPFVFLGLCRERTINLALNNLNVKKEPVITEQRLEAQNKKTENQELQDKSQEKPYEIKVVNPTSAKPYNINVFQQGANKYQPKKLEKQKIDPKKTK